jgi:hypothetical protein
MKLRSLKLDSDKTVEGVWVDYRDDVRLLIARLPNAKYDKIMRRLGKPHMAKLRRARFKPESLVDDPILDKLQKRAVAEAVLLDWEGVEDDDDAPLPYTPERGAEILFDPNFDVLWRFIVDFAGEEEMYRIEDDLSAEENSQNA